MKRNTGFVLFIFFILFFQLKTSGQQRFKLSGIVTDSLHQGVPGAYIRLIAGKDTLSGSTDSTGIFIFHPLKTDEVLLLVKSIGYLPYSRNYTLQENAETQALPAIRLKPLFNQLKEIVIKAKPVAVRLMKDTVEYDAAAYIIRENDRVEDLLKQLPGINVDKDGNVTATGKAMTKIRVDGKDFFTGNLKEFISQLPADMVAKLQVIDDYGEEANFTGIKTGEPKKMLNLVTKDKRNKGTFGAVNASGGTDQRYEGELALNFWRDTKQLGVTANATNTNTGAGISNNSALGFNFRNKAGKNLTVTGNYNYQHNRTERVQQSYIETVNSLGTIFTNADNESHSMNDSHRFMLHLQSKPGKSILQAGVNGLLSSGTNQSFNSSVQTGVIRQDLVTGSNSSQKRPSLSANFILGRKFKKEGRIISLNVNASNAPSDNTAQLNNKISYYDQVTGNPLKDSLLNQQITNRNHSQTVNANLTFTEPLGKYKKGLSPQNIDFIYQYSLLRNGNGIETSDSKAGGLLSRVDSLSNQYTSSFITQRIGMNYRYTGKKINYMAGIVAQPYLLTGAYEGRADRLNRSGFNFVPIAHLSVTSANRTYTIFYAGSSTPPGFSQLQPVRDTRNLQNVIIGNPDLKASFIHNLNLSYNQTNKANGSTLQLTVNGSVIQNQVASNTILIKDTLNSLKQETRYLNANGNYNIAGNYFYVMPFAERKYNLELKGNVTYNHQVSFADNEKNYSKGFNFTQELTAQMNRKWIALSANISYTYSSNVYSLAASLPNTIRNWLFLADAKYYILKSLSAGMVASKTINQGYSLGQTNPLLVSGYVEKSFFKKRAASMRITGNDLLNQGNNLNRSVSGNSMMETKSNQVTRYFLLGLIWRLQQFGGG